MNDLYNLFSDESCCDGTNRYSSIAVVSGSKADTFELNGSLLKIVDGKKDFKFKSIKSIHHKYIAKEMIDLSFKFIKDNRLRVSVIIWDKGDSRHNIHNRCDTQNMLIMYYRILNSNMKNWSQKSDWAFYPDEHSAIDWKNIINFLQKKPIYEDKKNGVNLFDFYSKSVYPNFKKYHELNSADYPVIQLADLYAGIATNSRRDSEFYSRWLIDFESKKSKLLFPTEIDISDISRSKLVKFEVLKHFYDQCKRYKMGVNYSESSYFKTKNPKNSLNFWHYTPQSKYDKAPTKDLRIPKF